MLGTAGRSTVRNVGGSSKPVKADPGDEGFCPRRRKNNLCYRSFITRYISFWSCWNVWNWYSIHQLSVLFADRKVAFFTILPLFRAERWWCTLLSSVKIFDVRFKLSRSVASKRLFDLHANGLSLAPKTNTKYYQKRFLPKNLSTSFSFFSTFKQKTSFLAPKQHLQLAPSHSWESAEKRLLPSMSFYQLFFPHSLIHKGALV